MGYRCMVRYLYRWDSDISDRVYRIRICICDRVYLNLFVGWVVVLVGLVYFLIAYEDYDGAYG